MEKIHKSTQKCYYFVLRWNIFYLKKCRSKHLSLVIPSEGLPDTVWATCWCMYKCVYTCLVNEKALSLTIVFSVYGVLHFRHITL